MLDRRHFLVSTLFSLTVPICYAHSEVTDFVPPHKKDADVDLVSMGKVRGNIFDPLTRKPIQGAVVSVRKDGVFPDSGPGTGVTDDAGLFVCDAELGRTQKKTDTLKLLGGIVGGAALPGTFSSTNRLDVDQLTLRVTAPGYKTFEGIARCNRGHASHFDVHLEPILLMPNRQPGASVCADAWWGARVVSFQLEPPEVLPGQEVRATLVFASPRPGNNLEGKPHKLRAWFDLPNDKNVELKEQTDNGDGTTTFRATFKAPKLDKGLVSHLWPCTPWIEGPFDYDGTGDALLSIVANEAEMATARERTTAFNTMQSGKDADAAKAYLAIAGSPSGTYGDWLQAGLLLARLGQNDEALAALQNAYQRSRNTWSAMHLLQALERVGRFEDASDEATRFLAAVRSRTKDGDLPKKVTSSFMETVVRVHSQAVRLDAAREVYALLTKHWQNADSDREIDNLMRLADAEQRIKGSPKDADALIQRAVALTDQAEWEEAKAAIERALTVSPANPILLRNHAFVRLSLPGQTVTRAEIGAAIRSAEPLALSGAEDSARPVKEFLPHHILGVLRVAEAIDIMVGGADPSDAFDRAHEAFDAALRNGRPAAPKRPRNATSTFIALRGFVSGLAATDHDLRQSLLTLRESPRDGLALMELGDALVALELWNLADTVAAAAERVMPNSVEPKFQRARVAVAQNRTEDAVRLLRAVIEASPYHPHARLHLANVLMKDAPEEAEALRKEHTFRFTGLKTP